LTPKAEPPTPPQHNIAISGGSGITLNIVQHGNYAKFSSTVQWYQQRMLEHGLWYWIFHGIVALLVVASWEYRHWFFALFR
jgi:hypothetical protein